MKAALAILLLGALALPARAAVSPTAVGFGNLIVPGLGATLRAEPERGLLEAVSEIGLFYGGTFGVREGAFTIDSTVVVPQNGSLARSLLGMTLQQMGLKLHMYNTFHHYQQAALADSASDRERLNPQRLYKGTGWDVIASPFRPRTVFRPWVLGFIGLSAAAFAVDYATAGTTPAKYQAKGGEDALYGVYNIAVEPLGSAYGEEPLFRGVLQREFRAMTDSLVLSLVMQSAVFTLLHPGDSRAAAFMGGVYLGYLVEAYDGDLGPSIAAHFWCNVIHGVFRYLAFRRDQAAGAPPSTALAVSFGIPL